MFSTNSETERKEREVLGINSMILLGCNMLQVTVAKSREEGTGNILYWGRGNDNGMDGGIDSSREEEKKGGAHLALHLLKKNLWGQPIRGWATPLSSHLDRKSCTTRQPLCPCSMSTRAHKETREQQKN